jgi:hypothetical protein
MQADPRHGGALAGAAALVLARLGMATAIKEAINTPFCPSQEKLHTFVLRDARNISEAP